MITQAICDSFKGEILRGVHDLVNDELRLALYAATASLNSLTATYTATGEVTSANYTAGGQTITGKIVSVSSGVAMLTFAPVTWSAVTITARGALLYNVTKSNRAIATFDFGMNRRDFSGVFTVTPGPATPGEAAVRIA